MVINKYVDCDLIDKRTGEVVGEQQVEFKQKIQKRGKRLNSQIWLQGLDWAEQQIIHSNNDLKIIGHIKANLDKTNCYRGYIQGIADKVGLSKRTVEKVMKRMQDIYFIKKSANGVYMVNPFVFIVYRVRGNHEICELQKNWENSYGIPTNETINNHKTLKGI